MSGKTQQTKLTFETRRRNRSQRLGLYMWGTRRSFMLRTEETTGQARSAELELHVRAQDGRARVLMSSFLFPSFPTRQPFVLATPRPSRFWAAGGEAQLLPRLPLPLPTLSPSHPPHPAAPHTWWAGWRCRRPAGTSCARRSSWRSSSSRCCRCAARTSAASATSSEEGNSSAAVTGRVAFGICEAEVDLHQTVSQI